MNCQCFSYNEQKIVMLVYWALPQVVQGLQVTAICTYFLPKTKKTCAFVIDARYFNTWIAASLNAFRHTKKAFPVQ